MHLQGAQAILRRHGPIEAETSLRELPLVVARATATATYLHTGDKVDMEGQGCIYDLSGRYPWICLLLLASLIHCMDAWRPRQTGSTRRDCTRRATVSGYPARATASRTWSVRGHSLYGTERCGAVRHPWMSVVEWNVEARALTVFWPDRRG